MMPSYSIEISNGSTTVTADGGTSNAVQPALEPDYSYEYNTDQSPAVISALIETWTLRDWTFFDPTPGTVTTNLAALVALLSSRDTPVTSVTLKYNGSAVFAITAGAYAQVTVRGLRLTSGQGSLANHWRGTLVVTGRKVLADSDGIVRLDMRESNAWDVRGLRTQTMTGRIEVAPGIDLTTLLPDYALDSLGAAFRFTTGGDASSDGIGNIDYDIENPPTNTIATFRSQQVEKGNALPATALEFSKSTSYADTSDGRITTVRAAAQASTIARALTAARTIKPSTGIVTSVEEQDFDGLTASATYTTRAAAPKFVAFYGLPTIVGFRRSASVSGGGQGRRFEPIAGRKPFSYLTPLGTLRIVEQGVIRAVNVSGPGDIPIPAPILPLAYLQNPECGEDIPTREDQLGEMRSADGFIRSYRRVYEVSDASLVDFDALFQSLYNAPSFDGAADYPARIAVKPGEAAK